MLDPDGHGWLYHRSGSFAPGMEPIAGAAHPEVSYDGKGDAEIVARFCDALSSNADAPLFITWVCEPDHSQHTLELGSEEHRDVISGSDHCAAAVKEAVELMRARGDDVLFMIGSDHGHETVDEIIPVEELMVDAGLKNSTDSSDVVLASSGMGALIYLSDSASERRDTIARWLSEQRWCGEVFAGDALEKVGLAQRDGLAIAFSMAKRDVNNRFGVRGFGHVAKDRFMSSDASGLGQHGGLGPYETNPFLIVDGGGFVSGRSDAQSHNVDIAPTILRHLGLSSADLDGNPLPIHD